MNWLWFLTGAAAGMALTLLIHVPVWHSLDWYKRELGLTSASLNEACRKLERLENGNHRTN